MYKSTLKYLGMLLAILIFVPNLNLSTTFVTFAYSKNQNPIEIKILAPPGATKAFTQSQFVPPLVSIRNNDVVKWTNNDRINHTISSMLFKSNIIYPQGSAKSNSTFTFNFSRPGVYIYMDTLQPASGGAIYVNASETQREFITTSANLRTDVRVEMPQNSAYHNDLGSFFIPSFVNVSEGVKVTWTNKDYVPHTATAADGSFDTKTILAGQSVSKIMNNTGQTTYYCKIHPWMVGVMHVTGTA